ncbi:MAG: hypothetical protein WDM71_03435 [Ferruginibacter sp.]
MAVGYAAFGLAIGVTLLMLLVLVMLEKLEIFFDGVYQAKFYKITFTAGQYDFDELQKTFTIFNIQYKKDKRGKT